MHARVGIAWLVLVLATSCGAAPAATQPSPTVVRLGARFVPPESLSALAASVRDAHGIVFAGAPSGALTADPPELAPCPGHPELQLAYPRSSGTVTVSDGLGDTSATELVVTGSSGPRTLVDSTGAPTDAVLIESNEAWSQQAIPAEGQWVFFVMFDAEGSAFLRWRARLSAEGVVDGVLTADEQDVPLSALRTAI